MSFVGDFGQEKLQERKELTYDWLESMKLKARAGIENNFLKSYVAAEHLLDQIRMDLHPEVRNYNLTGAINTGVEYGLYDKKLLGYDLGRLGASMNYDRDKDIQYLGMQILHDRYLAKLSPKESQDVLGVKRDCYLETPQIFFMRVALGVIHAGVSKGESTDVDVHERIINLYNAISKFEYMPSTPTLFNAGTKRPQMSSCYISTTSDSIEGIFKTYSDNAQLSKWSGGLGNDWTQVRSMGAFINGTQGKSSGVIPFLKVANDVTLAVNQGGRRRGSLCSYLETWHKDIEEFLELRKNTGDDRRRTHDMNTANWIPDLFMHRVEKDWYWTLFSPDDVPDLHDAFGGDFNLLYEDYERKADRGEIEGKRVKAKELWKKLMGMLYETGHPWITFKDPCNIRSPQSHCGVVHSSNLCCMTADQRVVTSKGFQTVGEMYKHGKKNTVMGMGETHKASKMLLPRPDAPIVQINTKEGYSHKVTPDHKVWVVNKGWTEAQKLVTGDKIELQSKEGMFGKRHNPRAAYLMGIIAGDGTYDKKGMVRIDAWSKIYGVLDNIEEDVHYLLKDERIKIQTGSTREPIFVDSEYADKRFINSKPLGDILNTKFGFNRKTKLKVPEVVWKGDKDTVGAYLRGMYQTDGTVTADSQVTTISLASINKKLLQDIQILWLNFGVKSSLTKMRDAKSAAENRKLSKDWAYDTKEIYRLMITSIRCCKIAESIVRMQDVRDTDAVASMLENIKKPGYKVKYEATFTELIRLPNEDAYCLNVESPKHDWIVNGMVTKNTEITLNTSEDEIAVCNLGSINLEKFVNEDASIKTCELHETVDVAIDALNCVVSGNFYPLESAETANLKHRPIGLGVMGMQEAMYIANLDFDSEESRSLQGRLMEYISNSAIAASIKLASLNGAYSSYSGSTWSKGQLPVDTHRELVTYRSREFGHELTLEPQNQQLELRSELSKHGIRNSNLTAIAPTATIANIVGVTQSIEPMFRNLYVKSNLSGEFTVVNKYLVEDLGALGLWNEEIAYQLKVSNGSVQELDIPDRLKRKYRTAFELDQKELIRIAAARQRFIDQSQSLNLYVDNITGNKLSDIYFNAWKYGLKTTYYLRSLGRSQVEKATIDDDRLRTVTKQNVISDVCSIDDEDCEVCQ